MSIFSRPSRKAIELELAHASAILEDQQREQKSNQFEQVLMRLIAASDGVVGKMVTPKTCMQSPTVHAIVTAVTNRFAVTPIHVYSKATKDGKETKTKQPDHPVAKLLARPNAWQSSTDFWMDAVSTRLRYGRFYAYKSQGGSGITRELAPLSPESVEPKLENFTNYFYRVTEEGGPVDYPPSKILHARGPARNFIEGNSPIADVQGAIMMEILAEQFGESFYRNGALPLMMFKYADGIKAFKTKEEEAKFIEDFQKAFNGKKRFNAALLPKGIDHLPSVPVENDKAQFIESRKYQRTVIAGAFGVPPHLVGDLERATFNNVEQQDQDFTLNVIMPIARSFEAAIERDLLTDQDRESGIIVRFNLDGTLRADFKSRQDGRKIQREMGVLNANEWREGEGMNPIEGGDIYWTQGPSGQNAPGKGAPNAQT